MKGSVLDQCDPLVPAIDVDQGSPSGDLVARQAQMWADMALCDTCLSAYVVGSVLPSSGGMAITPWQPAPDTVASYSADRKFLQSMPLVSITLVSNMDTSH